MSGSRHPGSHPCGPHSSSPVHTLCDRGMAAQISLKSVTHSTRACDRHLLAEAQAGAAHVGGARLRLGRAARLRPAQCGRRHSHGVDHLRSHGLAVSNGVPGHARMA